MMTMTSTKMTGAPLTGLLIVLWWLTVKLIVSLINSNCLLIAFNRPESSDAERPVRLVAALRADWLPPEVVPQNVDKRRGWSDVVIFDDCDDVVMDELSVDAIPVDSGGQRGHGHVGERRQPSAGRRRRPGIRAFAVRSARHRQLPSSHVEHFAMTAASCQRPTPQRY